jgi:uncharacterized membrane protein
MVVLLLVEVLAEQGEKEMTAESLFWWVVGVIAVVAVVGVIADWLIGKWIDSQPLEEDLWGGEEE